MGLDVVIWTVNWLYSRENETVMTQRRLRGFSTVTIDDLLMTNKSLIVTVLKSRNITRDQSFPWCT